MSIKRILTISKAENPDNPLTIVIPTVYKANKMITFRAVLRSLAYQLVKKFNLIIIISIKKYNRYNDTEITSIISKYLSNLNSSIYVVITDNLPLATARNIGIVYDNIKHGKNLGIAFVDDDVYLTPLWVKNAIKLLRKGYDLISGPLVPVPTPKKILPIGYWLISCTPYIGEDARKSMPLIFGAQMIVSMNALRKLKGFISQLGLGSSISYGEDMEFVARAIVNKLKIKFTNELLAYHMVSSSRTEMSNIIKSAFRHGTARAKYMLFLPKEESKVLSLFYNYYIKHFLIKSILYNNKNFNNFFSTIIPLLISALSSIPGKISAWR